MRRFAGGVDIAFFQTALRAAPVARVGLAPVGAAPIPSTRVLLSPLSGLDLVQSSGGKMAMIVPKRLPGRSSWPAGRSWLMSPSRKRALSQPSDLKSMAKPWRFGIQLRRPRVGQHERADEQCPERAEPSTIHHLPSGTGGLTAARRSARHSARRPCGPGRRRPTGRARCRGRGSGGCGRPGSRPCRWCRAAPGMLPGPGRP